MTAGTIFGYILALLAVLLCVNLIAFGMAQGVHWKDKWPSTSAGMHPFYYRLVREGELPSKNVEDKRCEGKSAWLCNPVH